VCQSDLQGSTQRAGKHHIMLHTARPIDPLPLCFFSISSHTSPTITSLAFPSKLSRPGTQQSQAERQNDTLLLLTDSCDSNDHTSAPYEQNALRQRITLQPKKVKVLHPLLLRGERDTKAHEAAAARKRNVLGEQKVLGLVLVWVYGVRCSMTGYTSYQLQ
jgi:hypothetical protein